MSYDPLQATVLIWVVEDPVTGDGVTPAPAGTDFTGPGATQVDLGAGWGNRAGAIANVGGIAGLFRYVFTEAEWTGTDCNQLAVKLDAAGYKGFQTVNRAIVPGSTARIHLWVTQDDGVTLAPAATDLSSGLTVYDGSGFAAPLGAFANNGIAGDWVYTFTGGETARDTGQLAAKVALAGFKTTIVTVRLEGTTSSGSVSILPIAPSSSAGPSGDLALVWSNTTGSADLSKILIDGQQEDLGTDEGLTTAVMLSLFLDRRAEDDDVPPSGDPTDRRGWWGDEFAEVAGDKYGSRLWLLDRGKRTNQDPLRAKQYLAEALQWMLDDRVVSSADIAVTYAGGVRLIAIDFERPGKDPVSFRFAHTWDSLQGSI